MKRSRSQDDNDSNIENFIRLNVSSIITQQVEENPNCFKRIYKCKDCSKEYDNFQALGGHRASHKINTIRTNGEFQETLINSDGNKLHVCKICKKGFPIGQALGGHMRMHWRKNFKNVVIIERTIVPYDHVSSSSCSSIVSNFVGKEVFKYDLNLTPEENEAMNVVPLSN